MRPPTTRSRSRRSRCASCSTCRVSEREQFLAWNLARWPAADFTSPAALRAYAEMGRYWTELVAERRVHRSDDLISQILHNQLEGEELSDEEIGGFCSLLHDASQNTTMNMIANAIITLAALPRRSAASSSREPGRWPQRARGAAALRLAGAGPRALDDPRRRAARR